MQNFLALLIRSYLILHKGVIFAPHSLPPVPPSLAPYREFNEYIELMELAPVRAGKGHAG